MAVRPDAIENQERGMDLRNRDQRTREAPETDAPPPAAPREHPAVAELRNLRARIAAVGEAADLPDTAPHCRDCFQRGARAALRAIRGE